jgi:hypothetical protein
MINKENSPIFIGGLDRSGKTTLRAYLHSHPNIAIPAVGSNMWTYFFNQYGDLRVNENFERCLSDMLRYKHVAFLDPEPDRIRKEFKLGSPTYAHLFSLFLVHFALREKKPRWGVQTGLIERYADRIISSYPGAKIIHMVRDPRDRYAGSLQLWPNGRLRAGGSVSRWFYSLALAKKNLKKYPDSYMVVRFEDLIRNTENTLKKVCDFLGEDFQSEMLLMPDAKDHREKLLRRSKKNNGTSPLSEEFIGIYKDVVPKLEIIYIQLFIGKLMKSFGYEPDVFKLSMVEKIQFLVRTLPSNFIRMVFWGVQEFLQQNFPNRFGRKPGPNMTVKTNISTQKV